MRKQNLAAVVRYTTGPQHEITNLATKLSRRERAINTSAWRDGPRFRTMSKLIHLRIRPDRSKANGPKVSEPRTFGLFALISPAHVVGPVSPKPDSRESGRRSRATRSLSVMGMFRHPSGLPTDCHLVRFRDGTELVLRGVPRIRFD